MFYINSFLTNYLYNNNMIKNILKPYSAVLFLNDPIAGAFILAVTFINFSVAVSGLFAVFCTVIFAKYLKLDEEYLFQGFFIYNSLLVGMGIGYLFLPSLTSFILIAISSIFTFVLSFMLNAIFSNYKIPILSLPFSIVTIFIYLATLKYSNLFTALVNNSNLYDIQLPLAIGSFFKAFGTILFLPNTLAGLLLFLIVLYNSRIIAVISIVGFYFGVFFHSVLSNSYEIALQNPYSFNYILTAIALCGIFLLPTIKNLLLALIGVSVSVVLTDAISVFFTYYLVPVFTIPFNLTVISFIFLLVTIRYKEYTYEIKKTPEKSLLSYLNGVFRFKTNKIKISLPFSGTWSVYQAFDDEWTHKGHYKYAYDFIKIKDGKSFKSDGDFCDDYYCFGENILSPISGYIVSARDDLKDNIIGEVDRINNWGNFIIIKSDDGFFVKVAHIMQHSLKHSVGEYVYVGESIAKCGNSGYSPQPHIHIQVQSLSTVGAFTIPFVFSNYIENNSLLFNTLPKKNTDISSMIVDKSIQARLSFVLDEIYVFKAYKDDKFIERVAFKVMMNDNGEFYFLDKHNNKLFFYSSSFEFYFYEYEGSNSYLKELFLASPKIPYTNKNLTFTDYLPIYLTRSQFISSIYILLSTINKNIAKNSKKYMIDKNTITSDDTKVLLEDQKKGFKSINFKDITLKRVS